MGIIVFIVVMFVLFWCLAGWLGLGLFLSTSRTQKKAEANAPAILDRAFVGDDVVYKVNMESLKYETVVLGAKARGYKLVNETSNGDLAKTLIFERRG